MSLCVIYTTGCLHISLVSCILWLQDFSDVLLHYEEEFMLPLTFNWTVY